MKKLGGVAVQKMYKRFKNRVLRKKGVEEKKCPPSSLISSEPLPDLRVNSRTSEVPAAGESGSVIWPCNMQTTVDDAASTTTRQTTAVLPSRILPLEPPSIAITTTSSSTTAHSTLEGFHSRHAAHVGPCSLATATPSSITTPSTAADESRTHLQQQPVAHCVVGTTQMHPMLSADSGVDVDCLESCSCSYADVDDVFTDDEDEMDDGWRISAHDVSLDKVINETSGETVYSGYWHGSVEVHSRRSSDDELLQGITSDVDMLSYIRHENIQLFLGVCHDLHSDYISIIMDQTKGQSLHSLVHRRGHQFSFQSATKIMSQIAQGMEYLHAKGIPHPLLSSRAVTVHYRVCISMLTPCGASQGLVDSDDIIYLPPEAVRTVSQASSSQPSLSLTHHHRGAAVCSGTSLKCDSQYLHTDSANVFSFGTLVYEMITMEKPFAGVATNNVIWEVGNERTFPLRKLQEGCRFRQIVSNCWRGDQSKRPSFEDLLLTFENNMSPRAFGLKSPFSFSEPSQLAKLGL